MRITLKFVVRSTALLFEAKAAVREFDKPMRGESAYQSKVVWLIWQLLQ